MNPDVKTAIAMEPYVVRVVFADGEVRDVDLAPILSGPVFYGNTPAGWDPEIGITTPQLA